MKHRLASFLVLCAFLGTAVPAALAQAPSPLYVVLDYMKVPAGEGDAYVQMEQEIWKPIHEERIRRGLITNWAVYGVWFAPPDVDYSYVTVNVVDDFGKLDAPYPEDLYATVHPRRDFDAMMKRTEAAREIVHTEVWQILDTAAPEGREAPDAPYVVVNYMQVPSGGGSDYVAAEREIWKPLHQARIDNGQMHGWNLYSLMLPSGSVMNYSYGTADFYDELADRAAPFPMDLLQQAHAGASQAELDAMMDRTPEVRTIYKTELWWRIDTTREGAETMSVNE